jgi:putative ribosome biogenesis GTPase RsgA
MHGESSLEKNQAACAGRRQGFSLGDRLDANVEHLLVLFTFNRPKLEPTALSRFFIEAESTGILSH